MAQHLETAVAGAQRATARVEELGRLRSAFVHNLAHELSTPLTPLAGYLRILSSGKLGALTPQQQRVVETMVQSVARLTRVVDNLADFASLEGGQAPLLRTAVEPDRLADEVVEELKAAIRDARLHVTVLHGGGAPVLADGRKVRQALANVVQNAVKFSPHGGEVLVEVTRDAGRVRFTVYDQGPGVPPGEAERIFEPLFHAAVRGGEAARLPGSGLGLPVARRIAEAHGGRVSVESPPRTQPASLARHFTGSKFVLELPARPVEAVRPAGATPAATPA
jgi:signal transduction histidine kinase